MHKQYDRVHDIKEKHLTFPTTKIGKTNRAGTESATSRLTELVNKLTNTTCHTTAQFMYCTTHNTRARNRTKVTQHTPLILEVLLLAVQDLAAGKFFCVKFEPLPTTHVLACKVRARAGAWRCMSTLCRARSQHAVKIEAEATDF